MQFEDLRKLSIAAAMDIVERGDRPVAATMVVPGGASTQILTLTDFPDQDEARHEYLANFAADQLAANRIPAWGFVVEAEINGVDAVVVVYGARKKAPELTAAPLLDDGLGDFVASEQLDPTAMPFLHPLQHAVDQLPAEPPDRMSGPGPIPGPDDPDAGLPLFGG